jgi:ubiquinone/menaquinone biosynthesis C-methylase UbiE
MTEELLEPYLRKIRINKIKKHIPADGILCDVGCGFNASFLRDISDYVSEGYGFDKKIEETRINNIHVKNADIEVRIPLEDRYVDCVTMLAVFEHLNHPKRVLSECVRILKPKGTLVLTTPAPMSKPLLEFLSFKLGIVSPAEIADHKHYYSKKELFDLLQGAGLTDIKCNSFEFGLNNMAIAFKRGNK